MNKKLHDGMHSKRFRPLSDELELENEEIVGAFTYFSLLARFFQNLEALASALSVRLISSLVSTLNSSF